MPPGIPGYDAGRAGLRRRCRSSTARTRPSELLKEAGYGEGGKPLKVEIRYNTNDNHKKVAIAVADMWKALGAT